MRYARTTAQPSGLYAEVLPESPPAVAGTLGAPHRILVVASTLLLPYRVVRAAAELGDAAVYVFGTEQAAGFRQSRFCRRFFPSEVPIDGAFDARLAEAINRIARVHRIDLIVAGDAGATRSLILARDLLAAPCFPMPDIEAFDRLNDKWRFKQLCDALDIPHPRSLLCSDVGELAAAARRGDLRYPIMIKPTDQSGGRGMLKLRTEQGAAKVQAVRAAPFVAQEFIEGRDIGACVYCEEGRIRAFFGQCYVRGIYKVFQDQQLYVFVERIVRTLSIEGILNFDIRLKPDGGVAFLECNPRVYFKIMMSAFADANLLSWGVPWRSRRSREELCAPTEVVTPKGLLLAPWRANETALRMFGALLSDPIPYIRERLRVDQ